MSLTDEQVERYARHILLPEIGGAGQAKIRRAKVLVVGAGGLGTPVLQYLAAAGVGTLGIVDDDVVDLSNLQRQVIHATTRLGQAKVASAKAAIADINPDVAVVEHNERLTAENARELISGYDIVADGCDNFATRFLVMDTCYLEQKTLVSGAILRFDGQLSVFKPHARTEGDCPCYRCLYPVAPPPDMVPSCAEAGVLGALCGTIGSLQAAEILKEITGAGESLAGSLIIFDGLRTEFRKIKLKPDPKCALCSNQASITDLSAH
ncbi:MAG: molybdopterin-synthase adenylyltransferase MoeB [Rhodospirillaceae bacterium]|nr:molybdopterin-synthase adenylyltransferase MoeB [Rhodospirillaceae bacterium]MBT7954781.1 molybdopterin-synthase adenylyltransferase MoeB [Rhodospirillaceae bacterium]